MKNLVEFINENQASNLNELANDIVNLLKNKKSKDIEETVDKLLSNIEAQLYDIDAKACSDFKNGVYKHTKIY